MAPKARVAYLDVRTNESPAGRLVILRRIV